MSLEPLDNPHKCPRKRDDTWEYEEEALENQLNKGALWAVTYGDLMSYLMLFFMILFVFNVSKNVEAQNEALKSVEETFGKEKEAQKAKKQDHNKEAAAVEEIVSKYGLENIAQVVVSFQKIRIIFSEPVLFDSGQAVLKPACMALLKELSQHLKDVPNRIEIEGHTDNVPIHNRHFPSNWELSSARSVTVLRAMTKLGVPPERMVAMGYGEYRPVAPNDDPESRGKNRRIEINIIRQE